MESKQEEKSGGKENKGFKEEMRHTNEQLANSSYANTSHSRKGG